MKHFFMCLFFMGWYAFAFAQQKQIQGNIKNRAGTAIAYASVMVKNERNHIVSFKASDEKGDFALLLPDTLILYPIRLEIRHLGYKTIKLSITDLKKNYPIVMEEQAIDLSQVEVKSRPRIDRRGDTLSYEVSTFSKNEDRSIGDVLKRMPGIEVNDKGEIKYNGKSISNFYIDDDDLLNDRYAIGSKTIRHDMVKRVEILQNHQPIKVLRQRVLSDAVALNLVIKEKAKLKLTGQAKIGLGAPHQYDSELNTVLFNKKYKMLNVLKANNIGEDLLADFTAFNQSSFLAAMDNGHPQALLSASTVAVPELPKNQYYFNRSGSLNANNLVNLKNGIQLKSNINVLSDRNVLEYNSFNDLYLEDDTVHYSEEQKVFKSLFLTDISLSAEANKELYYFRNRLRVAYTGQPIRAELGSNEFELDQQLNDHISDFSNHLEYVPMLKNKNIIRAEWYTSYYRNFQKLTIWPGINDQVLNRDSAYARAEQMVQTPSWFNKMSLAYGLVNGLIKQQYQIGLLNEIQQLKSALRLEQLDGHTNPFEGSDDNNLRWTRSRLYTNAIYEYKMEKLEASFSIPMTWQIIRYQDHNFQVDNHKRQFFVNPSLRLKVMTTVEDFISLNYSYNNKVGDINNVYRGAILLNYRSLQSNDALLQEQNNHQAGLSYNFQHAITMLFLHGGLSWSKATANAILSSRVTNNITQTVLVPLSNNVSTFSVYGGASKYIFVFGATAAIKASWDNARYNQLLNGHLFPYANSTFSLSPSIEARLWSAISLSYNATGTWMKSKAVAKEGTPSLPEQQITLYDQSVQFNFAPYKSLFMTVTGRQQFRQQKRQHLSYFFVDANVRYRIDKWHSDIEMNLINLADVKDYETYSISGNRFYYSHYSLRGRMAVLKYTFSF
ncbi:TonB-dependent receptor [Olivibacter domesticus]|uniref:CarboxypepD_reg-like domain-containing protein n=1 Tax=Olivibacter domesticus TaxID=407022 RepID=A0A1H7VFM6_OLID1|nr:TonB-dependent receptor [Olivibacter domesticus]SEM07577.1 hypothetical protein SAMN05661044_04146 [Olivibacter domesticus]